ncbi:hypothetical protein [Streptomyces antimycoticus]|uniref:hypothetical protein n=1 Tax=Streptomyces antimycoticus TaxID=68175 RepID=UPI001386F589|nr:hypothetical protein [Streptomyces antimycoticus]
MARPGAPDGEAVTATDRRVAIPTAESRSYRWWRLLPLVARPIAGSGPYRW